MYGVVGYKTHAKMTLIVRREAEGIRRYCHLGTGNYHPRTARLYTDYGLFTCDEEIGNDVHEIFLQLTSLTRTSKLRRLLQSPFNLHESLQAMIERESAHARAGKPRAHHRQAQRAGRSADHRDAVRASRSGVRIDLIVRGVCALRPGMPGVSENITVRSVVGRFLEHSRVYWFENAGEPELYLSSADWMERNFFRRVEVAFPVLRTAAARAHLQGSRDLSGRQYQRLGTALRRHPTRASAAGNDSASDAQAQLLERYAGVPTRTDRRRGAPRRAARPQQRLSWRVRPRIPAAAILAAAGTRSRAADRRP